MTKHRHHNHGPRFETTDSGKRKMHRVHKRKHGDILQSDVSSSFIDEVILDKKAGEIEVVIEGESYFYEGDKSDFDAVRKEGGTAYNELLRPQDPQKGGSK